jgi:hypothetical protein
MGIDWSSAWAAGQHSSTAAPAPAATEAPAASVAAAPATTTSVSSGSSDGISSSVDSVVNDLKDLWDGLVGCSNGRTSFGAVQDTLPDCAECTTALGDNYPGNFGNPWGSNMMKVDSTAGNDFTNTFINTQSKTITVNIWNKVGSDMKILSGASRAPKDTALTFTLAPGASQVVAFMENSQIGWAEPCSALTFPGSYQTTWGEAQFRSDGSGYDVSAINNPNNDYDMTITSQEAPACTSDRTQNFWLNDHTPVGGSNGSCYIAQSTAHLTTKMGGRV